MKVTHDFLVSLGACSEQRNAFAVAFPDGLDVTGEPDADVIQRVVDAILDPDWLCDAVLTAAAWDEYERVRGVVWAEHLLVDSPKLTEFDRSRTVAAWRLLANPDNIWPAFRK